MDGFRDPLPPVELTTARPWTAPLVEQTKLQGTRTRPVSARPGSRPFLQDTLIRLGEDSVRVGRRLQEVRAPSGMSGATNSYDVGSPSGISGAFWPDWSHSECGSPSPMRNEVEPDIKASVQSGPSEERMDAERVSHALLSVASVVHAWEGEVRRAADSWGRLFDRAEVATEKEMERWTKLDTRLDHLNERISDLTGEFRGQGGNIQDFSATQHRFNKSFADMLEAAISRITVETSRTTANAAASLREQAVADCEAVKKHAAALVVGEHHGITELAAGDATSPVYISTDAPADMDGDEALAQPALLPRLKILDERLRKIDDDSLKNVEEWRKEAKMWQQGRDEAMLEVDRVHKLFNGAQDEVRSLEAHTTTLLQQLTECQMLLEECRKAPAGEALQRLREIEARGHCRLDRLSGNLELLKPVEFLTRRPTESPEAELKDTDVSLPVLVDVAEVWNLFGGPLELQVHSRTGRGGSATFWERLAAARAELLRSRLQANGVPSHFIEARTRVGGKSVTAAQVLIRLGRDVFPGYLGTQPDASGRSR